MSTETWLGVNATQVYRATSPSPLYFDEQLANGKTDRPFDQIATAGIGIRPILQFLGEPMEPPSSAPEPPGVLLLGLGLLPILRRSCRRGRSKAV